MSIHRGFCVLVLNVVVLAGLSSISQAQMLSCLPGQPCSDIPSDVILTKNV